MKPGIVIAVAALVLNAFAAGWFVGNGSAQASDTATRLAAVEAQLAGRRGAEPPRRAEPKRPSEPSGVQVVEVGDAPALGEADAPVTIVEFSDFQCPFCTRVRPTLDQIRETYGDQVRIVFKHYPLSFHTKAMGAHRAALAAAEQGKFWPMHDLIFDNPKDLDPEQLRAHAETLGLDLARYDAAVASPELEERIRADQAQGSSLGVRGTPSFFINGRFFSGAQPFAAFKARIDEELAALEG